MIRKKIQKSAPLKTRKFGAKTPESHQRLIKYLRQNLNREFFGSLKVIYGTTKELEFEGRKYAVKFTAGKAEHGHNYGEIRKIISTYHDAVKKGIIKSEKCDLSSIKAIGVVDRYLVMPFVEGMNFEDAEYFKPSQALREVKIELLTNFQILKEKSMIEGTPQIKHFIYNEGKKGRKPLVYVVYDFY